MISVTAILKTNSLIAQKGVRNISLARYKNQLKREVTVIEPQSSPKFMKDAEAARLFGENAARVVNEESVKQSKSTAYLGIVTIIMTIVTTGLAALQAAVHMPALITVLSSVITTAVASLDKYQESQKKEKNT